MKNKPFLASIPVNKEKVKLNNRERKMTGNNRYLSTLT
jgi:hypothetical protein